MPAARANPAWQVSVLLYGSGLCALVYQTVWLREFRLIFGASTAASAAVLASFMGGLGLGALILGRRADAHRRPLQFYGQLELFVALSTAVTPALVLLVRQAYLQTGGSLALGSAGASCIRVALAILVLLPPTFAMGGTLPAAARAAVTASDVRRRTLALLYGSNTLGAVTGAWLATFVLLERCGNRGSLWLACLLNAAVAAVALALARRASADTVLAPTNAAPGVHVLPGSQAASPCEDAIARRPPSLAATPSAPGTPYPRFILALAGLSGFAFFLMEIVWYRMLAPLLGGSVFTFGLILAVALLGVGLGGVAYTWGRPRRLVSWHGVALTFGLEALCLAVPFALGDHVALWALSLRRWAELGFYATASGWGLVAGLVVFPASVAAGYQFPLLIALLGEGRAGVGKQVGLAYTWNTVGAMVGSLAGGFGLLPLLSAPGVWRGVVLLLSATSGTALVLARGQCRSPRCWAPPLSAAALAALLLLAPGPTAAWRHSGIGVGRADAFSRASPNERQDQVQFWRRTLLWEQDGRESNVALIADKGLAFLINGKNDGNARSDAGTVIMSGLIGALLHPKPQTALVIGLGTGSTAGWLGAVPSMQRVDAVELEPAVLRVAAACAPVNHGAMQNPKVRHLIGDARELLAVVPDQYDLIFSEPSNPYRAGIASLFTREFYRAAASKLTGHGLFLQWVQAYQVDLRTVETACATLATAFPVVETWATQTGDLLLVGAREPVVYDVPRLRERIQQEPFKSALLQAWRVTDLEGVFAHFLSSNALTQQIARSPGLALNTDDRTVMEFHFARAVALRKPFDARQWLAIAQAGHADRPPLATNVVDWSSVEEQRRSMFALESVEPPVAEDLSPDQRQRALAKTRFVHGDFAGALAAWRAQPHPPADLTELGLLAESLADAGDETAVAYTERLRRVQPLEAEAILARLRWRQGRFLEATTILEGVFLRYRSDPWPAPSVMYRAIELAQNVTQAAQNPRLAQRLHAALREPFAVRLWDQLRLACRFNLALDSADAALLQEAIEAFEPHVPWRGFFLEQRRLAYARSNDPRAARAEQDLEAFTRAAAAPRRPP